MISAKSPLFFIKLIFIFWLFCLTGWYFSDLLFTNKISSFQTTPEWDKWAENLPPGVKAEDLMRSDPTIPADAKPDIHLRNEAAGTKLLVKHRYGTGVFRYDSANRSITPVSEAVWEQADGQPTNCRTQTKIDFNQKVYSKNYWDYESFIKDEKLPSYGKYILRDAESPTHTKVALISAAGPKYDGLNITIFPGLGSGRNPVVYGQRYIQIMDMNTRKFHQWPIRVDGQGVTCWSEDEKYLVVYSAYKSFSVIETTKTFE